MAVCKKFSFQKRHNAKENFVDENFETDVLPNFPFTASETMCDYYL